MLHLQSIISPHQQLYFVVKAMIMALESASVQLEWDTNKEDVYQFSNSHSHSCNSKIKILKRNKKLRYNAVEMKDSIKINIVACVKKNMEDKMELVYFALRKWLLIKLVSVLKIIERRHKKKTYKHYKVKIKLQIKIRSK